MDEVTCRRAIPVDMQCIREIILKSFEDSAENPEVVEDIENETWSSVDRWMVAELGGEVVSAMGLRPGVMWMSGVPVPCPTVGTVCTLPHVRGKGIGSEMMRFASDVAVEEGAVLTRLHTSPDQYGFYGRLGYVKAITETPGSIMRVSPGTIAGGRGTHDTTGATIRDARVSDAERLNEIYEATFAPRTGSISRNVHFFERRILGKPKLWFWKPTGVRVVELTDESVVGYAVSVFADEGTKIVEIAMLPDHAEFARMLVIDVADRAGQQGLTEVTTSIDPFHPLGWLVDTFDMDDTSEHDAFFLKVHDQKRFVELASPVIEERACKVEVHLTLRLSGFGDVCFGRGREVSFRTDVDHLVSLFYNGRWLKGLVGEGMLSVQPDTARSREIIERIFLETHPCRGALDGY